MADVLDVVETTMRTDDLQVAADPVAVLEQIQQLRRDFCAAVTLVCDDADSGHTAVEVMAEWTLWQMRRYEGPTLEVCLARAVRARALALQQGGAA